VDSTELKKTHQKNADVPRKKKKSSGDILARSEVRATMALATRYWGGKWSPATAKKENGMRITKPHPKKKTPPKTPNNDLPAPNAFPEEGGGRRRPETLNKQKEKRDLLIKAVSKKEGEKEKRDQN